MGDSMGFFHNWLRGRRAFSTQEHADNVLNSTISSSNATNLHHLSMLFTGIPELITRTFQLHTGEEVALVFMDGLVNKASINMDILRPLLFQELNEKDFPDVLYYLSCRAAGISVNLRSKQSH
jgi:spore germination protein